MFARIVFAAILLAYTAQIQAQQEDDPRKYFFYDKSCMKKFDYKAEQGLKALDFYDFHLPISKKRTVVFRVEKDQRYITKMEPGDFTHALYDCDNITQVLTEDYLADVHSSIQIAFLLETEKGGQSTLYQVKEVYTLEIDDNHVLWRSPLAGFEFLRGTASTQNNIYEDGNRGGKVFWKGQSPAQGCLSTFRFKQLPVSSEMPSYDLHFVENVGLLRMVSSKGGRMQLQSINNRPIDEYMEKVCKIREYNAAKRERMADRAVPTPPANRGGAVYDPLNPNNPSPGTIRTNRPGELPPGEFTSRGDADNPAGVPDFYVVEEGDNLYNIAKRFGTSVDELARINQLKNLNIDRGQKLKVRDDGSAPPEQANPLRIEDPIAQEVRLVHVVHQGETLGGIARKYGLKIAQVKELNNLESDFIDINQRLLVGSEPMQSN